MSQRLDHLSCEEIETLMGRYYEGETVAKLIKEYRLDIVDTDLYRHFPPEVQPEYSCEYCGSYLVVARLSRKMAGRQRYESELYCPICKHRPFDVCRCRICTQRERMKEIEKIKRIQDTYFMRRELVDFSEISFENKVFLGAICYALLSEDLYEILPYDGANVILASTKELTCKIYRQLMREGIICISPVSPIRAFSTAEDNSLRFDMLKVTYHLNLVFPMDKQDLFAEILNPMYYSKGHTEDALLLWKEIAVSECIEYLQYQLEKVRMPVNIGEKTKKRFEIILCDFSVSQVYRFIYGAVTYILRLYREKRVSRDNFADAVVSTCERNVVRAKIDGWEVTKYGRIRDLPQSKLAVFYFNRVLRIGDKGFDEVPSLSVLEDICRK